MGHYVYQYLHPEYGHLYCGRTEDLDKRIYEHNNLKSDNIPREYEKLLKESIVMYIELKNKAQEIAVEAYCIDKYKPYLNKALKYMYHDDEEFVLEMKLPKWKMYNLQALKYNQQLLEIKKEESQILESISNVENDIQIKKDDLNRLKFKLNKINYEIETRKIVKDNNVLFGFTADDIKFFYKYCENKNAKFYSEVYDKIGNMSAKGCMYFDLDKNILTFEYWSGREQDRGIRRITTKELFFDMTALMFYDFYPDVNIYPELYAALLSKKDELSTVTDNSLTYDERKEKECYDRMLLKYNI